MKEEEDDSSIIQIYELEIDQGRRRVLAKGSHVELTFTEFQILYLLARRPGWVFTHFKIVDSIRGDAKNEITNSFNINNGSDHLFYS